jgi:hypothetical protein
MPPPESLEAEIARLERQISDILSVRQGTVGPLPTEGRYSLEALEEAYRSLNNARQRQLSVQLSSINESSNRLEAATRNLQQSSEAQLIIAESQHQTMESQAKAVNDLLKSSRTIEQFSLFLIVLTIVNIFIVEAVSGILKGELGVMETIADVVLIVILMAVAYRWPNRLLRRGRSA